MESTEPSPPTNVADPSLEQTGGPAASSRESSDKAAQLGLGPGEITRRANLRRSPSLVVIALTLLAYLLVLVAFGFWFHQRLMSDVDSRINSVRSHDARIESAHVAVPPAVDPPGPVAIGGADAAGLKRLEDLLNADAGKMKQEMDALSKRLAGAEEQNRQQAAQLGALTAELSAAKTALAEKKPSSSVTAASAPLPQGDGLPPAQGELVLLKERNRLTDYADEAIATGARAPYERLWEALDDPRLANLVHAARAEILRVQNFYLGGSRIDHYDIPVMTYFPDDAALRDGQLKDDQLIKLLRDKKNPWEVRMKAANLLGTRHSAEAGDALAAAVKTDDNLDVVKEATFSFEQMTGFRARIFDAASLDQWWKQYKATPTPPKPKAKATNAKDPNKDIQKGEAADATAKSRKQEPDTVKKKP
jgi:hypothetical protein